MSLPKIYYVYIMTNRHNTVLYVGVTNNIFRRGLEHKSNQEYHKSSFTRKYNVNKLVYFEEFHDINEALAREKQIKAGSRQKKIELINKFNSQWKDLLVE